MESNQASISSLLNVTDQHEGAGELPLQYDRFVQVRDQAVHQLDGHSLADPIIQNRQQELSQFLHYSPLAITVEYIDENQPTRTNLDNLEESNMDDDWNVGRHRIVRILDQVHSCPDSHQTSTKRYHVGDWNTEQGSAHHKTGFGLA